MTNKKHEIWKYSLPEVMKDPLFNEHWLSVTWDEEICPINPPQYASFSPLQIMIGAEASNWKPKLWHWTNEVPPAWPMNPPAYEVLFWGKISLMAKEFKNKPIHKKISHCAIKEFVGRGATNETSSIHFWETKSLTFSCKILKSEKWFTVSTDIVVCFRVTWSHMNVYDVWRSWCSCFYFSCSFERFEISVNFS